MQYRYKVLVHKIITTVLNKNCVNRKEIQNTVTVETRLYLLNVLPMLHNYQNKVVTRL